MKKERYDNGLQITEGLKHQERKGIILFSTEKQRAKLRKGKFMLYTKIFLAVMYIMLHTRGVI